MAKAVKRKAKGNVISLDFAGVKSGGATIPDGRYAAKITAVEQKEGKESGEPYLELTWEVTSKKCNGREVRFDNYSQQPQALWRLKGLLEALEIEVPDGDMEIDFDELISDEAECIIEVTGQTSPDGDKKYARVTGHAPLSDGGTVDDDEEGEEEDDKPARGKKPAKDEEEEAKPTRRKAAKEEEQEEEEEDEPPRAASKKVKKGAKVKFKDEKNKLTKGTIESIDGDTATVVTDDEDTYEIDIEELTIIG